VTLHLLPRLRRRCASALGRDSPTLVRGSGRGDRRHTTGAQACCSARWRPRGMCVHQTGRLPYLYNDFLVDVSSWFGVGRVRCQALLGGALRPHGTAKRAHAPRDSRLVHALTSVRSPLADHDGASREPSGRPGAGITVESNGDFGMSIAHTNSPFRLHRRHPSPRSRRPPPATTVRRPGKRTALAFSRD